MDKFTLSFSPFSSFICLLPSLPTSALSFLFLCLYSFTF